jgi:hypothetical protein
LVTRNLHLAGAALGGTAVILFERYEQKDKSGAPACLKQERPNLKNKKSNASNYLIQDSSKHLPNRLKLARTRQHPTIFQV